MKNNYSVYIHTCPNKKVYIGITCQTPKKRWGNGSNYKANKHFYNAIIKYGWNNIKHEILYENLTSYEAYEKEKLLIALYKSNQREYGYNNSAGGEKSAIGVIVSDETKEKLRQASKGNKNALGRKHSISEINNMIKASPRKKRVYQYTTDGVLINSYISKRQAIRETSIDMGQVLINKKKTAGGYKWSYDKVA